MRRGGSATRFRDQATVVGVVARDLLAFLNPVRSRSTAIYGYIILAGNDINAAAAARDIELRPIIGDGCNAKIARVHAKSFPGCNRDLAAVERDALSLEPYDGVWLNQNAAAGSIDGCGAILLGLNYIARNHGVGIRQLSAIEVHAAASGQDRYTRILCEQNGCKHRQKEADTFLESGPIHKDTPCPEVVPPPRMHLE